MTSNYTRNVIGAAVAGAAIVLTGIVSAEQYATQAKPGETQQSTQAKAPSAVSVRNLPNPTPDGKMPYFESCDSAKKANEALNDTIRSLEKSLQDSYKKISTGQANRGIVLPGLGQDAAKIQEAYAKFRKNADACVGDVLTVAEQARAKYIR
jgi:hypothetical protein